MRSSRVHYWLKPIVGGMLALLAALVVWWLFFFYMHQKAFFDQQSHFDEVRLSLANGGRLADYNGLERVGKNYVVSPKLILERESELRRKMTMLVCEALFLLGVISYGSYRVVLAVTHEGKLAQDREIFMNSVSHELKTPISVLLLQLQTLLRRKTSQKQTTKLLEESVVQVRRLEHQVNELLTGAELSKDVEGKGNVEAASLIRSFIERKRQETSFRKAKFTLDLPDSLFLNISRAAMERILSHLIENSVQYAKGNPRILIKAEILSESKKQKCKVTIADNGIGIPTSELTNVFDAFYRVEKNTGVVRGTGLGLYLVKRTVEMANGSVIALNNADKGTTIEIILPVGKHAEG